jgi:hypothetical protein
VQVLQAASVDKTLILKDVEPLRTCPLRKNEKLT